MSYGAIWQVYDNSSLILERRGSTVIIGAKCGDEVSTIELPPAAAKRVADFINIR